MSVCVCGVYICVYTCECICVPGYVGGWVGVPGGQRPLTVAFFNCFPTFYCDKNVLFVWSSIHFETRLTT